MIAQKAIEALELAINFEFNKITTEYGDVYASNHEAYAVLLEEVEEAAEEVECIKIWMDAVWKAIKGNQDLGSGISRIKEHALDLAKEAVQVAAVCERFQNTLNEK